MAGFDAFAALRIKTPSSTLWLWSLPCFLVLLAVWVAPAIEKAALPGSDFANFWVGAKHALAGNARGLYDIQGFRGDVRTLFPDDRIARIFSYPPNILPLILPFGLLPYGAALACFSLAGTAGLIFAVRTNRFSAMDWRTLAPAVLSPAALFSLFCGQNGAVTAALFLGGLYLCESAPVTAGILFGLLTIKPHLGLLVPAVLLLRRNRSCIAAAACTAVALAGLSVLFWGIAPWQDYARITVPYQAALLSRQSHNEYSLLMPGPYADASMLLHLAQPWLFYAPAALLALVLSLSCVRREGISARSVLSLAIATMIVTPYGYTYDMTAIMGALAVYLCTRADVTLAEYALLALLWALPATLFLLKALPLPLGSLILLGSLYIVTRTARGPVSKPEA